MTFLFWAAAIVVFALAEAATTALVSIWFAVGAAAAMVASIFTASLGVHRNLEHTVCGSIDDRFAC